MKYIKRTFYLILVLTGVVILFNANLSSISAQRSEADSIQKPPASDNEISIATMPAFSRLGKVKAKAAEKLIQPQIADSRKEKEPNDAPDLATPLATRTRIKSGTLFPVGDVDYYSFTANAGDRVYAATMTSASAGNSDTQLTLLASDGRTVIEYDDDNGSFSSLGSSIAGAVIPTTGMYYIKVNDFTLVGTPQSTRPYDLWLAVQSGSPLVEVEPNDSIGSANPIPPSGWVSGARGAAPVQEPDVYSLFLNGGDTVYLGLDLDPERDGVTWNGKLAFGLFGGATNSFMAVDDSGSSEAPYPTIPSEDLFMTVKTAGTYYILANSEYGGGPQATYNLNVTVLPSAPAGANCTTYTSTDVPRAIGPAASLTSSTLTVPGNPRVASARVILDANHAMTSDMDVHLRSPAGNDNGLFTDIGSFLNAGESKIDVIFDDEAGIPPSSALLSAMVLRPEAAYRLGWFKGENAGGTWTLDIRDDTTNASGGLLNAWGLEICEEPAPSGMVLYNYDFETGAQGFTHSGTADEWELGLPATAATNTVNPVAAFSNCNSGTTCWKTDLDGTYDPNSSQDLVSPNINLTGFKTAPATISWAMRYQLESAALGHASVSVREVGNPDNSRTIWQFLDATMTSAPGETPENIGESAGWGTYTADISDFLGKNVEVVFHLDSDGATLLGGFAVDDVIVRVIPAANVGISGKVVNSAGFGIPKVAVTLTGPGKQKRTTMASAFGTYYFDDVEAGQTYTLTANKKSFRFQAVTVTVSDWVTNADIVGTSGWQ